MHLLIFIVVMFHEEKENQYLILWAHAVACFEYPFGTAAEVQSQRVKITLDTEKQSSACVSTTIYKHTMLL